ncbi:hypothetical protein [Leptolyngbya sp. BC1307]|uniref:hypothetical protein n=1 Tax=Leptolyngbya sp. BC1307 TaxID=2029589 RepID=UPI000EFAF9ED|nr:hypothetical protein [Leptolyngbya sp. BC1307]
MTLNSRPVTKNISFGSDISSSTQIADRYSDNLMDDLFIDVDQILEGDLSSAAAVSSPQADHQQGRQAALIHSSARTVALPTDFSPQSAADIYRATLAASSHTGGGRPVTARVTAPSETAPSAESIEVEAAPMQSAVSFLYPSESLLALPDDGLSPRSPQTLLQPQQLKKLSLPFLLMGAAGISLVSALGLWLLPGSSEPGWLLSLNKEAAAAELPDHSDQAFLQYLGQSLEVISARESSENQTVAAIPPTLSPTAPSSETTEKTGTLPILPNIKAPANIVERVFVPVYETGQTAQSASQSGASLPTVPPSPTRIPLRAVTAPLVPPVPRATALPAPRPAATTAVAPTNPTSGAAAAVTDVTPATDHVLVGILNLGDRSAAMFNIDGGSSQRAYVGDRIGLSSWTLVTVNGQDVVLRRDGEVRSIYIGQSF